MDRGLVWWPHNHLIRHRNRGQNHGQNLGGHHHHVCNICQEGPEVVDLSIPILTEPDASICVGCLTTLITRVVEDKDQYPVKVMQEGDLNPFDYTNLLDAALLEKYMLKELEHSVFPADRVYCSCGKFTGRLQKPRPGEVLIAIGTCKDPKCDHHSCLLCASPLDASNFLAAIKDHGCIEVRHATAKDKQKMVDSSERGKKFQLCPTCTQPIQLTEACNHIRCPCGAEFCYACGELASDLSGHWGPGRCSRYLQQQVPVTIAGQREGPENRFEPLTPEGEARFREIHDDILRMPRTAPPPAGATFRDPTHETPAQRRRRQELDPARFRAGFLARPRDTVLPVPGGLFHVQPELLDDELATAFNTAAGNLPAGPNFRAPPREPTIGDVINEAPPDPAHDLYTHFFRETFEQFERGNVGRPTAPGLRDRFAHPFRRRPAPVFSATRDRPAVQRRGEPEPQQAAVRPPSGAESQREREWRQLWGQVPNPSQINRRFNTNDNA